MTGYRTLLIFCCAALTFSNCEPTKSIDTEKPTIDLSIADAFPVSCDTLYFGETFSFKVIFKDNIELGSARAFSIDIHHNFDHHSHSTEVTECDLGAIKQAINPFVFIDDYDIPEGLNQYTTNLPITISAGNENGLFDEGDYHFYISLTDKEGWSVQKGLSIKIMHR